MGGGGALEEGSGRGDGGGYGWGFGRRGFQEGQLGGGVQVGRLGAGGAHAPKAKRWLITGSPYLPLPSL